MSESKVLRDALEVLNSAGLYQQASELALKAAKRDAKPTPTSTRARAGGITQAELDKSPTDRGYLTHRELLAATNDQMTELRMKHPELLAKSLSLLSQTKGL